MIVSTNLLVFHSDDFSDVSIQITKREDRKGCLSGNHITITQSEQTICMPYEAIDEFIAALLTAKRLYEPHENQNVDNTIINLSE